MSSDEHADAGSLATRETAEICADLDTVPALVKARKSVQAGDVVYGVAAARALLAERNSER
jgi:hypothetical protein